MPGRGLTTVARRAAVRRAVARARAGFWCCWHWSNALGESDLAVALACEGVEQPQQGFQLIRACHGEGYRRGVASARAIGKPTTAVSLRGAARCARWLTVLRAWRAFEVRR